MGDTDRLHDRKSQAHTTQIAASRLVGPEKALEDMRESASGNSCVVIRYFQDGRARLSANPDFDLAAFLRVLDRVVHQIQDVAPSPIV
jgi:hypothetical protein